MLGLAGAGPALAHSGGTMGYASVSVHGGTVRYSLTLALDTLAIGPTGAGRPAAGLDYDALAGLVARKITIVANGRACQPVPGSVSRPAPDRANIVITVDYACPGRVRGLALRDDLSDELGDGYHALTSFEGSDGSRQYVLEPERREARVDLSGAAEQGSPDRPPANGVVAFFRLGIEHILSGFDHLLFLFALILRGGTIGSLLVIVTAFTVAHSITLALAVLDLVTLPPQLVEPVIALSIVYVAFENIFFERAVSRRWAVGFVFGLVHGFGFAGALLELGLPTGALVGSLVSFNLGVEAGQALVIAGLLPALLWLRRFEWERRAVTTLSALVLTAGLALLVERALFTAG